MAKPPVTDVEFEVIEGRGRVRWGRVLFTLAYLLAFAAVAYQTDDRLGHAILVFMGGAVPFFPKIIASLSAELPASEAEALARRVSPIRARSSRAVAVEPRDTP